MNDDEPDAIHYFREAAEDMEHDVRITFVFLGEGVLRLAESLVVRTTKEAGRATVGLHTHLPLSR